MPSIEDDGDIDIHDIAIEELFIARNAVAHHVVDGCADGFWEAFVIEWSRDCAVCFDHFAAEVIEMFGCDARLDVVGDHVEDFGGELSGFAHAFEISLGVDLDAVLVVFCCLIVHAIYLQG